jgi:hypothetical protein
LLEPDDIDEEEELPLGDAEEDVAVLQDVPGVAPSGAAMQKLSRKYQAYTQHKKAEVLSVFDAVRASLAGQDPDLPASAPPRGVGALLRGCAGVTRSDTPTCAYTYIDITHTYIHRHKQTCTHTLTHTYTRTHTHADTHIYTHIHTHTHSTYAHIHIYAHIHMLGG